MYARMALGLGGLLTVLMLLVVQGVAQGQSVPAATAAQTDLVINEFMASNSQTLEDPDEPGEFPDWIELYNPTDAQVNLRGLFLVKGEQPNEVTFPITTNLTIPAKGYLVFFADDDRKQGPLHANFKLNKDLDRIALYGGTDGTLEIDSRSFTNQVTDQSDGRDPDGGSTWRFFSQPTPGRTNSARPPVITDVAFSPPLPQTGEAIRVTAVISDDGAILQAMVVYTITGSGVMTVPMAFEEGTRFAGVIPPQPDGVLVGFYVHARDNDGEIAPNPLLVQPQIIRFPIGYSRPNLVINEFMSDNIATLEDADDPGDFADWIELYNPGTAPVSLAGLYLTDDPDNPTKFAISADLSIGAKKYMVFLADEDPEQGPLHANFKLNKDREIVAIYGAQGTVAVDRYDFNDVPSAASVARIPDGSGPLETVTFCPTPGKRNIDCPYHAFLPFVTHQ